MLEDITKPASLDVLTPNIQLNYKDYIQIQTDSNNITGHIIYQAKLNTTDETHHIRAFNSNSTMPHKNMNQAITLFLQETLRLCYLNPEAIIKETFEFYDNKICYAMKPIAALTDEINGETGTNSLQQQPPEELKTNSYVDKEDQLLDLRKYLEDPNPLKITTIELPEKNIGAEGAQSLSKINSWLNLTTLDLQSNNIGEEGAIALSRNNSWVNLTALDLEKNGIGAAGAIALSKNSAWTKITALNLYYNNIGSEGAAALSQNSSWTNLTMLNLQSNKIRDKGARELSTNSSWKNLRTLNLQWNDIGDEGAVALSSNTSWTELMTLNLQWNYIGDEGTEALNKNKAWAKLELLDLQGNTPMTI